MLRTLIDGKLVPVLIAMLFAASPVFAANTADDYFEDASRRYQGADYAGAFLQLKNALRADRAHTGSLLLMGNILIKGGSNAPAEAAFTQALEHGADPQSVMTRLAESYLKQGKFQKLLDDLSTEGVGSRQAAEIMGYQAIAHLGNDQPDAAGNLIESALAAQPHALMPRVARCQILLSAGRLADALALATTLIDAYPDSARAWLSLGRAAHAMDDYEAAIDAYGRATKLDAYLPRARIHRAGLLIHQGRGEEALVDLDFLAINFSMDPRVAYIRGLIHERAGERDAAEGEFRRCTELLSNMDNMMIAQNAQLTMQGAISHMRLGEEERARAYLEGYQVLDPDNVTVNRALASLLLDLKETDRAERIIDRLLEANPDDRQLLALKARIYKQSGQPQQAAEVFLRIAILGVGEFDERARTALRQIGAGKTESGQKGLRNAVDNRRLPEKESFDLATAYLIAARYPEAIVLATALVRLDPGNQGYLNLLGEALMQAGKLDEAHVKLREAESRDSKRVLTQLNLARVEAAQGKIEAARGRLESLLAERPKDSDIVFQLAHLERQAGNEHAAIEFSQHALALSPTWNEPRIFLTKLYLKMGMAHEAIELARETVASDGTDMEVRFLLGEVLEATGNTEEAGIVYEVIAQSSLFDEALLRRVAEAQIRIGAWRDASYTLLRTLQLTPDHIPTRVNYIRAQLVTGNYKTALESSETLVADYPREAAAYTLRADALVGLARHDEAVRDYSHAHEIDPSNPLYKVGAFRSLVAAGKADQGEALISQALRETTDNILLYLAYIDYLIQEKRWPDAEEVLRRALDHYPENPVLLNNMATMLHKQQKDDALRYALRAYERAPELAQINDTLGWILVDQGGAAKGLGYLQTAVDQRPQDPEIRYHLGVAYLQLERLAESKTELQQALSSETDFDDRQEVSELLQSVQDKLKK